jgi:saccharopine dehydrogenase-like NADP-dependent oxidoreductase
MRVVALGAGGMGRYAAKTAAGFDFVDELIIADLDQSAASRLAESIGSKARSMRVDVTDASSLATAFEGAHAVLNSVGPFFRLGPPVLRAAIAAKCHYLDINDDWESTEAMMALNSDARAAGITAVIGIGASPGISNLLAVTAMRELDQVDEVYAGFDLDAAMPESRGEKPCAATIHGVHQLTGTIRVFDGGKVVDEPPLRRVSFEYPGLGRCEAFTMGHPEAITFPASYPELSRCLVLMTMSRTNMTVMRVLARLVDAGWLSVERAAGFIEWAEGVGKPVKTPEDYLRELLSGRQRTLPPLFAVVNGRRNGRRESVAASIMSAPAVGMGGATGVPLAVGLAAVRPDGDVPRGVFAPEAIIDPDAFFDRLAPLCTPKKKSRENLLLVSRSWENLSLRARLSERAASAPSSS